MQWEYFAKQIDPEEYAASTKDNPKMPLDDYMDMMGKKGWELVAVAPYSTEWQDMKFEHHMLYFKRPVSK